MENGFMIELGIAPAERKKQYYAQQYRSISALLRTIDPCEVRTVGGVPQCTGNRAGDADADVGTLCCTGCHHLSAKGCRVKSLGCKMWLCTAAFKNLLDKYPQLPTEVPQLLKEIQETNRTCQFYDIPFRSRHSMEENLAGTLYKEGFKASKEGATLLANNSAS
ncbi:MAG: hypothetical protein LBS63_01420 [Prevotellaceae bacterium]|jgi:hypothetical protein|nr:hypothetical protein [Prevotellaceae bacterium]